MLNKYRKPRDLFQQLLFFPIVSLDKDIHTVRRVRKTCPKGWIAFPARPPFNSSMLWLTPIIFRDKAVVLFPGSLQA